MREVRPLDDRRIARIQAALDGIGERRDILARRDVDPVSFIHRYADVEDKEMVGLLASSLAFGNVKAFRPKIEDALSRLGPRPARAGDDPRALRAALRGWKHREYTAPDLAGLVVGARMVQREHGTLGAAFAHALEAEDNALLSGADGKPSTLQRAASRFARSIRRAGGLDRSKRHGAKHILVDPMDGSAAKRLLLFFRWMIRRDDGVDAGLWDVPASRLLIPVDVHIHRLARNLGLTKRASATWDAAVEITNILRHFDPEDPVKYDFPLCHMGMLQHCPSKRDDVRCEGCGVKPVCLHWEPKKTRTRASEVAKKILPIAVVALAAILGACGGGASSPRNLVAVTSASAPASVGIAPSIAMPSAYRARMEAAVAANAACEKCHEDIAAEWHASLHAKADVEPAYVRSFAIEPLPFCRGCHAPESVASDTEPASVRDLGVGCVTCHVTTEGAVLAIPRDGPELADHGPHAIQRDAHFASEGACSGCHEFTFPTRVFRSRTDLMQSTIAEHAESPGKNLSCSSCHMPFDASHKRSHAFVTTRDASVVRRAVRVSAERTSDTHVRVRLTPEEMGHAFPTGDLFRRLEVSAEAVGPDEMVLGSDQRYLARHFGAPAGVLGRTLIRDDRVGPDGASIELDVGDAGRGRVIAWRVAYQRVAHPNGIDESDAALEGELELASGRLPAESNPAR